MNNIVTILLTGITASIAALKIIAAQNPGTIDPAILQYIADGEDAFAKASTAHSAAQVDQTAPLDPLKPIE